MENCFRINKIIATNFTMIDGLYYDMLSILNAGVLERLNVALNKPNINK